jgi:hypothetical protein
VSKRKASKKPAEAGDKSCWKLPNFSANIVVVVFRVRVLVGLRKPLYRSGSMTLDTLWSAPCRYWYEVPFGFLTRLWSTARQVRVLHSDFSCQKRWGTSHVDMTEAHWVYSKARRLISHDEPLANLHNLLSVLSSKTSWPADSKNGTPSRYYVVYKIGSTISCSKHILEKCFSASLSMNTDFQNCFIPNVSLTTWSSLLDSNRLFGSSNDAFVSPYPQPTTRYRAFQTTPPPNGSAIFSKTLENLQDIEWLIPERRSHIIFRSETEEIRRILCFVIWCRVPR